MTQMPTQRLPDFNRDEALARTGDDPELLVELVELYLEQAPSLQRAIELAATDRDPKAIEAAAHALKGSLLALACERAAALALALERHGRTAKLDEVPATVEALGAALARLRAVFEAQRSAA